MASPLLVLLRGRPVVPTTGTKSSEVAVAVDREDRSLGSTDDLNSFVAGEINALPREAVHLLAPDGADGGTANVGHPAVLDRCLYRCLRQPSSRHPPPGVLSQVSLDSV